MDKGQADQAERECALDEVIASYLRAEESGTPPDRADLLARHPDMADELARFFQDRDRMKALAGAWRALQKESGTQPAPPRLNTPEPVDAPPAVRTIGRFELLRKLGEG